MNRFAAGCALLSICLAVGAQAQQPKSQPGNPLSPPAGVTVGPSNVTLGANVAVLKLPNDYAFLDREKTKALLEQSGEPTTPGLLGVVQSADEDGVVFLDYASVGYMKDDDADRLNPDDLLRQMKDATEEQNEERKSKGGQAIHVTGWYKTPVYDRAQHTLNWAAIVQVEGTNERVLNDTTVLLGRQGILICDAVGPADKADKLHVLLNKVGSFTHFNAGSDYASFRSGDRISELTMTGLVTGGAAAAAYGAAKVGLLAKAGKLLIGLLLALKKAIILVIIAVGAAVKKIWSKITGREDETVSTTEA